MGEKYFVEFDTLGREFRCKWEETDGNKSLERLDAVFKKHLASLKAIKGVKSVKRVVCGGCHDFKIVVEIAAANHEAWEKAAYSPESTILAEFKAIPGVKSVETQLYTFMSY